MVKKIVKKNIFSKHQIKMSVAITNGVNYSLKPTSVRASRKQLVIPSSNKTDFSPEDTCVFYLPSLRNNVMDGQSGYLRFTVQVATAACNLDVSAHSLIERIMTYGAGGQLISDIQNYSVLGNMLLDLQLSQSEKLGLSPLLGTEDVYGTTTSAIPAASLLVTNRDATGTLINVGAIDGSVQATVGRLANAGAGAAADVAVTSTINDANRSGRTLAIGSYTFCIPLLHPLFTLSEKMFPCFAMADDTRLEITWSSVVKAVYSAGAPVLTIKNPEIIVDYIEFDSAVFPMIAQTYAGRELIVPAQDYRYYSSILPASAGNVSQIIPSKQMSARAFFFAFRPAETQIQGAYAVGSRVNPFWAASDNFRLNIGGVSYPQKPITTRVSGDFSEWYASTQTALHAFNSLHMDGGVSRAYYQKYPQYAGAGPPVDYRADTGVNSFRNAFSLGINLDTLRGQSETQNSGLNLANVTTYYEGTLANAPKNSANADQTISVDTYVLHDVMFIVDQQGNVSLRF